MTDTPEKKDALAVSNTEEKTDLSGLMTETIIEEVVMPIVKKVVPHLETGYEFLGDFLGNDERRVLIQKIPDSNSIMLFVIESESIESFEVDDKGFKQYSINEVVQLLMDGDLEKLKSLIDKTKDE